MFFLSLLSLLSGSLIVCLGHFFCLHSFIVLCVDTLLSPVIYCPMCRTIAQTCISSVACTPWYCSSLNCSARLVVYFSSNLLVLSTALPDVLSLLYLLDTCCVSYTHLAKHHVSINPCTYAVHHSVASPTCSWTSLVLFSHFCQCNLHLH